MRRKENYLIFVLACVLLKPAVTATNSQSSFSGASFSSGPEDAWIDVHLQRRSAIIEETCSETAKKS